MSGKHNRIFSTSISREQAKDSGMAVVLILLIIGFLARMDVYFSVALGALLMNMIFPMFYYPFAVIWFGISRLLGSVMSKVLLSVIYVIIVLPVALLRRLSGKDSLLLGKFKRSRESVMRSRNHLFEANDLEKPF